MQLHIENISSINVLYILCLQVCEFTEQPGPQLEGLVDRPTATPLDYFFMLFPVTLLQMLVAHSNSYAAFCMALDGPDAAWVDAKGGGNAGLPRYQHLDGDSRHADNSHVLVQSRVLR